jgi:reductive dehalogenase
MKKSSMNRRNFLKMAGIGAAALGTGLVLPTIVAETENGVLVESEEQYGGFLVEQLTKGNLPYKLDPSLLKPMSQRATVFSRNHWDPLRKNRPGAEENLSHRNLVEGKGIVPNQTRLDYAFMAAAWSLARVRNSPFYDWTGSHGMVRGLKLAEMAKWLPEELDMDWKDASRAVKHAALFYGASLAGIAHLNPLWIYSDHYDYPSGEDKPAIPVLSEGERLEQGEEAWYLPGSMNRVIALAFEEDYQALSNSPGRVASAAVGDGYSRMAVTSHTLAEFIRGLGYRAAPAGNGTGLSIPIAIDAGLGQSGRMGLLVTPKYGPRVRLAKVITDMPLIPDPPIDFGVTEFCVNCLLCADHCPSEAVTKGPRSLKGKSISNNPGVLKWYGEPEKCYDFNGFSCSNCKSICPFNKPNNSWLHKTIRTFIKVRSGLMNKAMVTLDQASGYGEQLQTHDFWKLSGDKCITAREEM